MEECGQSKIQQSATLRGRLGVGTLGKSYALITSNLFPLFSLPQDHFMETRSAGSSTKLC
jgi:hypothetical protein